jgi:ligand-binding SRPBCC domain-containing protein
LGRTLHGSFAYGLREEANMHSALAWGAPEQALVRRQWVPGDRAEVFEFFQNPHNLARITPPWLGFTIRSMSTEHIETGAIITYRVRWMRIPYTWRTLIVDWTPPERFVDTALTSPYVLWRHTHTFEAVAGGVAIGDSVRYRLPFGPIGVLLHGLVVRRQLETIFDYRQRVVAEMMSGGVVHTDPPTDR